MLEGLQFWADVLNAVGSVGEAADALGILDVSACPGDPTVCEPIDTTDSWDAAGRPEWASKHPPSRLRLVMTLVDNRSGVVLWHSDRHYRVDPTNPAQVRIATRLSFRTLPCGSAPVRRPRRVPPGGIPVTEQPCG
jgi:hypothetical protein